MAVKTKADILDSLKTLIGDKTDDDSLNFISDVSDTLDDFENKTKSNTDWEQKYKENDESWRKKYKERFFSSGDNSNNDGNQNDGGQDNDETETKPKTYDNLFTSK